MVGARRASWEDGKKLGISPPFSPGISGKFREKPPKTGVLGSCGQFQGPTPPFLAELIPLRRQLSPPPSVYRGFTKGPGGGSWGAQKGGFWGPPKGGILGGVLGPGSGGIPGLPGIRLFAGQVIGRNEELKIT